MHMLYLKLWIIAISKLCNIYLPDMPPEEHEDSNVDTFDSKDSMVDCSSSISSLIELMAFCCLSPIIVLRAVITPSPTIAAVVSNP